MVSSTPRARSSKTICRSRTHLLEGQGRAPIFRLVHWTDPIPVGSAAATITPPQYWKHADYSEADAPHPVCTPTRPSVVRRRAVHRGAAPAPGHRARGGRPRRRTAALQAPPPKARPGPDTDRTSRRQGVSDPHSSGEARAAAGEQDETGGEDGKKSKGAPHLQRCCDAFEFKHRPGRADCSSDGCVWYQCGWSVERREPLEAGTLPLWARCPRGQTGIATLSATEHGRKDGAIPHPAGSRAGARPGSAPREGVATDGKAEL
jgi:hypothetical protein